MPERPEATVFVVDDEPHVRASLCRLLRSAGFSAQPFGSAEDFLQALDDRMAGCVLIDVKMPGMAGLELQVELRRREILLPVIVMSGYAEIPDVVRAVKHGALDFLEKPFRDELLIQRVQEAIDQDLQRRATEASRDALQQKLAQLTAREREIMRLLASGKTTKQAAYELGISPKTADIHRSRILTKMHVENIVALVNLLGKA